MRLESLEGRLLPSTFTVNTPNDTHAANAASSPLDSNGNTSLRSAIEYIDAKQLSGSNTITFGVMGNINLNSAYGALRVSDTTGTVTITGAGQNITVNGGKATEDFSLASGTTVTLDQLKITGGSARYGGGIFNSGDLTLSNSTLYGNTAITDGGGLYNYGTAWIIGGSTLSGNSAANGAGIYTSGTATISGSTLSANSAQYSGGGIWARGSVAISGSTLSGNTAGTFGGGVYNDGAILTIAASHLTGNTAAAGGGLANFGIATISGGSTLSGNTASSNGGGILNGAGTNSLTVLASTVSGNSASTGGGVYNGSSANFYASGSTLSSNAATVDGGGLFNNSAGVATLLSSTFSGNTAYSGGGIYSQGSLTLSGSMLSGNYSSADGGGIDNANNATLTVSSSTLYGNSATNNGGGIWNGGTATITASSTISGNFANSIGGGIYNRVNGTLTVYGSTLSGNTAARAGGGIASAGSVTVSASTLSGNFSSNGGGIQNSGSLMLTNSTLLDNDAYGNGGGFSDSGTATLSGSTLTGNSATTGGGIDTTGITTLTNTLVAANAGTDPDIAGSINPPSDHNLIGDGTGMTGISNGSNGNQVGTAGSRLNPLLSAAGTWGGTTQVLVPLPGSPAIGGGGATNLTTDQRGFPRVVGGRIDIGSVETGGYAIALVSGSNQATVGSSLFPRPLIVQVTADNGVDPLAGGWVTFLPPSGGASASLSPTAINASGQASSSATANNIAGFYVVIATDSGASSSASFNLTNIGPNPTPTPMPTPSPATSATPTRFIASAYLHLLGRAPMPIELTAWTILLDFLGNTPLGRTFVVVGIETLPEYSFVEVSELDMRYLKRSAFFDPETPTWMNLLGNGSTVEQVAAQIVNSPEFIRTQTNGSFGSWLNAFSMDALGRPVDPSSLAVCSALFASGANLAQIAEVVFIAPPLPGLPADEYHIDLVDGFFVQFLGRSAAGDPSSLSLASLLQRGVPDQGAIALILGSPEFYNNGE